MGTPSRVMKKDMKFRSRFLIVLAGLSLSGLARAEGPALEGDWQQRLAQAAEMQERGKRLQGEADRILEVRRAECQHRFLVNACLSDAAAEHLESTKQARLLINEGKAVERQVRKEELNERDRRRDAEAPQKAAEIREREQATLAEREAAAAEESALRARKAREAEAGSLRRARDAERLQKKQQEHAARVASKKAAAERRAAGAKGE